MALTKTTVKVTNISELSTKPNATEGLTDATFKALFDESSKDIKDYINNTLTEEIDAALASKVSSSDLTSGLASKLDADDESVTNSRKCDNTFDNATTSRTNLGLGSIATRNITVSISNPSGGSDNDIWIKYTA